MFVALFFVAATFEKSFLGGVSSLPPHLLSLMFGKILRWPEKEQGLRLIFFYH